MEGNPVPEKLSEELKAIMQLKHLGSGSAVYKGWYASLLVEDEMFEFEPNVASIASQPPDIRTDGGIVYIGTGGVQLIHIICEQNGVKRAFVGPVYSTYEVVTRWGVRLSDEEWKIEHTKYAPIDLV